jgi:hypothetical protein
MLLSMRYFALLLVLISFASCGNEEQKDISEIADRGAQKIMLEDTLSENFLIVKGTILGKEAYMLLDNGGANQNVISIWTSYLFREGIIDSNLDHHKELVRINAKHIPVSIGPINDTLEIQLAPRGHIPDGRLPDALLGSGFIKRFLLEINYVERWVKFHDTTYRNTIPAGFRKVDLDTPNSPFVFVKAKFYRKGSVVEDRIGIDLGAGMNSILWPPRSIQKHKRFLMPVEGTQRAVYHMGFSEKVTDMILDSVDIDGWVTRNVPAGIMTTTAPTNANTLPILAGNALLKHAGVAILDISGGKLYLKNK